MKNPQVGDRVIYKGDLITYFGGKGIIKKIDMAINLVEILFDAWPNSTFWVSKYPCIKLKKKRKAPENVCFNIYSSCDNNGYVKINDIDLQMLREYAKDEKTESKILVYKLVDIIPMEGE